MGAFLGSRPGGRNGERHETITLSTPALRFKGERYEREMYDNRFSH